MIFKCPFQPKSGCNSISLFWQKLSVQNPVLYGSSHLSPYRTLLSRVSYDSMPCLYEFKGGHQMLQLDDVVSGGASCPEGCLETDPALAAQAVL